MIPYIEHNGAKYEFKINRYILKEIVKLQKELNIDSGDTANGFDFLERAAALFLSQNYNLTGNEIEAIFDNYENPAELYELLGAIADTVFTGLSAETENKKPTNNTFLAEYRQKKETEKQTV